MNDVYTSNKLSVVVDNNVLVDLFELNCLPLLFQVFDHITIPKIIYDDEITHEIKTILIDYPYILGIISTEQGLNTYGLLVNDPDFKRLSMHDRVAISIAKENLFLCNSNDRLVRKACEKHQVKITGVLGVLGRAYYKKHITCDELLAFIDELSSIRTSCYIDTKVIEQFKKEIFDVQP